ncbi:MAG: DUF262 domain-containing protein [Bacteroidales bacterium]|nr:DUF262 domain-containing protein [Bacteroidales bacterium]
MKNEELDNTIDFDNSVEKEDLGESKITKPYDPGKIKVNPQNVNLGSIIEMLQYKEIDLMPDFQREGDLWSRQQKSQLIESLLLGLPLPSFYFSEYKDDDIRENKSYKWAVVDGLQRLSTFQEFIVNENSFALEGLEFLHAYENKKYNELSREDKRKISGFKINLYVIEKTTPKEVKFLIFKRVNTGGLILTPQEIRHALNQGIPAKFVKKLAELDEFKKATDYSVKTHRQADRDFVNRFIAFYLLGYEENYYGELDSFLNDAMGLLAEKTNVELNEIEANFKKTMILSYQIFGNDAFRKRYQLGEKRKPISKAVYDTIAVNIALLPEEGKEELLKNKEKFSEGLIEMFNNDKDFHNAITTATGQKSNVKTRFERVKKLIELFT